MRGPFIFCFLSLALVGAGCASKTSSRYREGDNAGQKAALTVAQERALTQEALKEMKKDFPPAKNAQLQNYIQRLGHKIVEANQLKGAPYFYHFTAVDSDQINAFALPAGEIFITVPILAMADSEAEIAGVLGHEIGHVVARHSAERMYVAKQEQGKSWLYGGLGAALGGVGGFFLGKKLCDPRDKECQAKFALYGAAGGGAAGLMVQKYAFMKNSQEDELESDRVGFRYAVKAGYNKSKVGDFYRKLAAMEGASKKGQNALMSRLQDALSSHPAGKERVAQAEEMKHLIQEDGKITSSDEFFQMKKIAQDMLSLKKKK
jgi:predicted Zn-dependent protease